MRRSIAETEGVILRAKFGALADYEDAVIVEAGRQANAECIVTRNERDFAKSAIPAYSPTTLVGLLAQLSSKQGGRG